MKKWLALFMAFALITPLTGQDNRTRRMEKRAMKRTDFIPAMFRSWSHTGGVTTDSIRIDRNNRVVTIFLNQTTTHIPVRSPWINDLRTRILNALGRRYRDYSLHLQSRGHMLEEYIPNAYRDALQVDTTRFKKKYAGPPLVRRVHQPEFRTGLHGRHIALWPSHGFFFDQQLNRWQWQRARLWQTVEDIFPLSYTSAYLVPMLENAGATVLLPRERDTQTNEVVVDNNGSTGASAIMIKGRAWDSLAFPGFRLTDTIFPGQKPFLSGTSLVISTDPADTVSITYIPDIPETGDYAVYVSYAATGQCMDKISYRVSYSGGEEEFQVNQCMGGGTWVYLGTFHFITGFNPGSGSVVLSSYGNKGVISSDAVRFGGGMGNVARKPGSELISRQRSVNDGMPSDIWKIADSTVFSYKISGKPRWMEGSRYYLQYAGMPDTITYDLSKGKNDYNDDYMSRPEWVNFLIGPSSQQYNNKYDKGLNIPVDLALAFHTDAGVTEGDSVIGTLGIYSTTRNVGLFPDGRSKLSSRDLTDLVQTQIVEDIRSTMNPQWTRRGLWDREYSEAWRPVVPSMLLELLSHQNLADMQLGVDPRFKFTVSRAIYKGILRYLEGNNSIIQPLPPDHLAVEVTDIKKIKITWRPVIDRLEPTAMPDGYSVYVKAGDSGFAPGIRTSDTSWVFEIPEYGKIYSFRITAWNDGGESFPGETLSAAIVEKSPDPVLVVNAFDRISAPAFFDRGDMAGIAWWQDEGVPYITDRSFTGYQYDFNRNSDWIHDDNQGWGASNAGMETVAIAGNSFSFPAIHGKALVSAGFSFVSASDEAFESPDFNFEKYAVADVIFGEERGVKSLGGDTGKDFRVFTPGMIQALEKFTHGGGNVFISGAYIGTDMNENHDSAAIHFAANVLHFTWRTNHATTMGTVKATDEGSILFPDELDFNTDFNNPLYRVESPDAIEPHGDQAVRIYRYASGNTSAGVAWEGAYRSVVLGFPFETITDESKRTELMGSIMNFFRSGKP